MGWAKRDCIHVYIMSYFLTGAKSPDILRTFGTFGKRQVGKKREDFPPYLWYNNTVEKDPPP